MERRALVKTVVGLGAAAGLGAVGLVVFRSRPEPADTVATPTSARSVTSANGPLIQVHKSPTCGCCEAWVTHLRKSGFIVEVFNEDNLDPIKTRLGVPFAKGSCHTCEVEGYLIEGHVPAEDIRRLLAERPRAKGLVLPGMPIGSPGMEIEGTPAQPFTVELLKLDGTTEAFSNHPGSVGSQGSVPGRAVGPQRSS
jgi:hypothetical protein